MLVKVNLSNLYCIPDIILIVWFISLQWRHNDHDGVSNHQPHGCLLSRLFRRRSKKTSKLRVTGLCVGNSPGPVNSPHKGPVTRKMFPFDDVIMYPYSLEWFYWRWSLCQWINANGWACYRYVPKHNRIQQSVNKTMCLTHWGRDKMAASFQTTLSNGFSWMKMYEFRLKFHWSWFPRVQSTIFQHWFR